MSRHPRRDGRRSEDFDHLRLGRWGEDRAAKWYLASGHEVLARNWRCAAGELDLVCRRGATLVVCEVKTRSGSRHGSPFEAVGSVRQRRLRAAASAWLAEHRPTGIREVRFDVAAVTGGRIEVVTAAF